MKGLFFFLGSLALVLAFLIAGKVVFAPLIIGFLLSNLLIKPVDFLNSKGWSNVLSTSVAVVVLFGSALGVLAILITQYYTLLDKAPSFMENLDKYKSMLQTYLIQDLNVSQQFLADLKQNLQSEIDSRRYFVIGTIFESLFEFISFIFILPIFTFLLLIYRNSIKQFIHDLAKTNDEVKDKQWIKTLNEIQDIISHYITGLMFVTLILAAMNTTGLLILGVPYAIILGVSAAILSVVPYIGNLVGGGMAVIMTLVTTGNHVLALGVVGLFAVIQAIEGNLITPKVMNSQIGVNPLVVILSLMIGGYIWGIIGMIISIPIIAILILLFKKREGLKPFVALLES